MENLKDKEASFLTDANLLADAGNPFNNYGTRITAILLPLPEYGLLNKVTATIGYFRCIDLLINKSWITKLGILLKT